MAASSLFGGMPSSLLVSSASSAVSPSASSSFLPEKPTVRQLTNFVSQWQNQFEATEDRFRKSEEDVSHFLHLHKRLKEMDSAARRDTERLLLRGKEVKALADRTETASKQLVPVCESDTQLCQEINRLYSRTCVHPSQSSQLMTSLPFAPSVMHIPTPFTTRFLQDLLKRIEAQFGVLLQVETAVKHLRSEPPEKELDLLYCIMEGHYKYTMLCQEKEVALRTFLCEVQRELEKANIILPGAVLVNTQAALAGMPKTLNAKLFNTSYNNFNQMVHGNTTQAQQNALTNLPNSSFNTTNSLFNTPNSSFNTGNSSFNTGNSLFNTGNSSFNTGNSLFQPKTNTTSSFNPAGGMQFGMAPQTSSIFNAAPAASTTPVSNALGTGTGIGTTGLFGNTGTPTTNFFGNNPTSTSSTTGSLFGATGGGLFGGMK